MLAPEMPRHAAMAASYAAETAEARQAAQLAERGAERERSERERLERAHIGRTDRRATVVALLLSWSLACLLAAVVAVGVVATIPGVPLISVDGVLPQISIWTVAVITLFTVVVRHVPVLEMRRNLERVIQAALSRRGPPATGVDRPDSGGEQSRHRRALGLSASPGS
jgi:uncharacterized membrane protein YdbT with pleckstrin-like domain